MTGNMLVKQEVMDNQVKTVRGLLEKIKPQIESALPRHITADRIVRVVINACTVNPELLMCDQRSLLRAVLQSSILGLEPNTPLGEAYLIPYNNRQKNIKEVQLQAGYQGLMKLARNSGEVSAIESRIVYEKDIFEFEYGLHPKLIHKPVLNGDHGALTAVYCIVHFKNPDEKPYVEIMGREDIEKIKKSSQTANKDWSPWKTHEAEMWRKSVIRRASKYIPRSIELVKAITLDDQAEIGEPQTFEEPIMQILHDESGQIEAQGKTKSDKLAEEIGGKKEPSETTAPNMTPEQAATLQAMLKGKVFDDDDMAPGDPKNHQDIKGKTDELPLGNSKKKGSGDF